MTTDRIYILASDHRIPIREALAAHGEQYKGQTVDWGEIKYLIHEGLRAGLQQVGLPLEAGGILVDDEYGMKAIDAGRTDGMTVTIPVEVPRAPVFEFFEGDDGFAAHIDRIRPDNVKVLADPFNTSGLELQDARLRRLSDHCRDTGVGLMYEFLVKPSDEELAAVDGDLDGFAREIRPARIVEAIDRLHAVGIEPTIWKVEGLETQEDYKRVVEAARADGRDHVQCIVLGGGASDEKVCEWLATAGAVDGFDGFAIGRTGWATPIVDLMDGQIDRETAIATMAGKFASFVEAFESSQ